MSKEKQQTAVEWFYEQVNELFGFVDDETANKFISLGKQAKEMEKNSYICSKCKSHINGSEVMQQMQDSEKSD